MYGYAAGAGSTWFLALRLGRKGKGLLLMYLPGIFPTTSSIIKVIKNTFRTGKVMINSKTKSNIPHCII